jgi:hypothetical protein
VVVHGDAGDVLCAQRAQDAASDLAAIRNEHPPQHLAPSLRCRRRGVLMPSRRCTACSSLCTEPATVAALSAPAREAPIDQVHVMASAASSGENWPSPRKPSCDARRSRRSCRARSLSGTCAPNSPQAMPSLTIARVRCGKELIQPVDTRLPVLATAAAHGRSTDTWPDRREGHSRCFQIRKRRRFQVPRTPCNCCS